MVAPVATGTIAGFGAAGYRLAIEAVADQLEEIDVVMKTVTGLAPLAVSGRLDRLRARFADLGVDALLVTRLPNVRYLTGFTGSAGCSSCSPTTRCSCPTAATASRRARSCDEAGVDVAVEIRTTMAEQRAVLASAAGGAQRIGLEDHGVSWAQQRELADAFGRAELVPAGAWSRSCAG